MPGAVERDTHDVSGTYSVGGMPRALDPQRFAALPTVMVGPSGSQERRMTDEMGVGHELASRVHRR
ncbi:hypothetical protein Pan216_51420 [Planctomycetes bacterium Pan216]|uniref:Uncharacterized protein n=1 Tax=Kolteria novifilia TaxID=2527975 RepID=A0A518BBJ1_9BACT|nr:hypothetical protein Pan216_51420 [Planctomycetes bacterium Pan216]